MYDSIEFIKPVGDLALKKCPFCGGNEVVYEKYQRTVGERFRVVCIWGVWPLLIPDMHKTK